MFHSHLRLSLGYQAVIAVLLGVGAGLFFGPYCSILRPVGDIFVMLLQMVVLPYICFSLIHGLGSLSPDIGAKLFKRGWVFLLILWALIFAVIYLLSQLIPKPLIVFIKHGDPASGDLSRRFLSYLVPENPFYDLANNIVPAVAVFGLIVGSALMHIERKELVLNLLEKANQTIEKILKWLAIISPIGIFAHLAVAFGTVRFTELGKLEFYVISFIAITLYLSLWVLPALISSLTPLTFREALKAIRGVCLLAFATGLSSISLPFINHYMKRLGETEAMRDHNFHATSQTVMPICYGFGQIGNCLILFYILFLSFYYRHPLIGSEKALLSILTVPMSIGSSANSLNAVSFLINQLNFPQEAIQLFTETMAVTMNFQVLLSVASVLTLIILVLYAYYGHLEVKWSRLATHCALPVGLLLAGIWGLKPWIHLDDNYRNLFLNLSIRQAIDRPPQVQLFKPGDPIPPSPNAGSNEDTLASVLATGVLRVGYDPYNIPYCYWNNQGELVGYDVAFAYQLARDLDCRLELVPIDLSRLNEELDTRLYDIGMAAILMTEERIKQMDFSHPYTEQDNVLVVPTKKRSGFLNLRALTTTPGLKIGTEGAYSYVARRHFPLATPYSGSIELLAEGKVDAQLWSQTPAMIWCLSHPHYVVIEYGGLIGRRFFAYPSRSGATDWLSFLNNWLALKSQSGFTDEQTQLWIKGELPQKDYHRWSILHDVLLAR